MWRLHTSVCVLSIALSSSPLNYASYILCATRHWSSKYRCLVQRFVIRRKDLVKRILWNYSNALCVWNCSSRIIYLEKGTFKDALSLLYNFYSSPLFTDISCISWTFANCRASFLFWYETALCFPVGLLIGERFIHEIKNQGFFINPLWALRYSQGCRKEEVPLRLHALPVLLQHQSQPEDAIRKGKNLINSWE